MTIETAPPPADRPPEAPPRPAEDTPPQISQEPPRDTPPLAPPPSPQDTTPAGPAAGGGARRGRPHPGRRVVLLPLALLALVATGAVAGWAVVTWRTPRLPGPLVASGTVEADEVQIGSEVLGRLVDLPVVEGGAVHAGDVVARLDDTLIQLQLQQADVATQRQLKVEAERYTLRAPLSGVVTRVPARVGEVASPGQTLAVVSDLRRLKLTVYVLERDLGRVRVGQQASVAADPFPGRAFSGAVTSINAKAEFTPRNVQTERDRRNLVFGVQLRVDNPQGDLKPGMPVDATFRPAPAP